MIIFLIFNIGDIAVLLRYALYVHDLRSVGIEDDVRDA